MGHRSTPFTISQLTGLEILDSRGNPTLQVQVRLASGEQARAEVPAGASTGSREAVELRDHDPDRYAGMGVLSAVAMIAGEVGELALSGRWPSATGLDEALIDADGTPDKSRFGANTIVGVSMAVARALAADGELFDGLRSDGVPATLPVPHFNVLNGGVHAPNALDFQEFMIAPIGAPSFQEAVRSGASVYSALRHLLRARGLGTGLGDEGGFAPDITRPEDALTLLTEAIEAAGYLAGPSGVAIALDPAASEFYRDGRYQVAGETLSTDELIERYAEMVRDFPVWSIEDGLDESDWDGWARLTSRLGPSTQLVGDDIFVTNPVIIAEAADRGIANCALIKPNQIGTVSETLEAVTVCRRAGYRQMVSHRSGETPDSSSRTWRSAPGAACSSPVRQRGESASSSTTDCSR